ncbi:3'-5' exoribonuclease HELZ2-like [Lytechinus pictus]|uniref:3'-5' exoribonuclease HELZ2-like n=1 Tax=Lytechinus pictus TaxID=7653 RepID=UPI0030BA1B6E
MDWEGMDSIVWMWRQHHNPFLEGCILNFIKHLHGTAYDLLQEKNYINSAQFSARGIQLYNVLDKDGYLSDCRNRNRLYCLHAEACIRYADQDTCGLQFLEIALQSLMKVSDALGNKKILRLIANLKIELMKYSESSTSVSLGKLRRYNSELRNLEIDRMKFVASFFGFKEPRELFDILWRILETSEEGAVSLVQQPGNNEVEPEWIPIEHIQIAQRQSSSKPHHSKKKKSRRDGKSRPGHASPEPVPQPSGKNKQIVTNQKGQRSSACTSRSGRTSGERSTVLSGARKIDSHDGPASTNGNEVTSHRAGSFGPSGGGVHGSNQRPSTAEDWIKSYKLRLACKKCFTKAARSHGYSSYKLNTNPTHFSKCTRDYLLCQLARKCEDGQPAMYGIIRSCSSDAKSNLCEDFLNGDPCKELDCCYCHSREEQDIWKAEREGRFPRDDVIALLKTLGHCYDGKSNRETNTPARSRSKSLASQDHMDIRSWSNNGAKPRRQSQVYHDNGDPKIRSNSEVRSQSGSLQTSHVGSSSLLNEDANTPSLHDEGDSKEMYEVVSTPMPLKNQFEILVSDANSVQQRSSLRVSSPRSNQSRSDDRSNFNKSAGLPAWQTAIHVSSCMGTSSASSVCNSRRSLHIDGNNSQTFPNIPGQSKVRSDEALMNELKQIRGKFLIVCSQCLECKPMKISPPHQNNPQVCSYKQNHSMINRSLIHQIGHGRFTKIRKRPFRVMHKPRAVCRYIDRLYGCEREDSCQFAHSQAEAKVWWLEARLGKHRDEITDACIELNQPAEYRLSSSPMSNPKDLMNPYQNKWDITTNSDRVANSSIQKEPPPVSRAIAVESCSTKVPFSHAIKRACGRCLRMDPYYIKQQNPKSRSYCSGSGINRHYWKANIVYVVWSSKDKQWVCVHPRHPRLWPDTKLNLCRHGKKCTQESVFRTACMHPHTQEELQLWEYQQRHDITKLEEVVGLQQQAEAVSTPLPKPEEKPQHICSFCKFSSTSKTEFENHLVTDAHKAKIFSDSDRLWKERDPPNLVQDGCYEMCKENATKECEHSGRTKEENECIYAHSMDELMEWKERHKYRVMKLIKAREMKLYSWLDNLVEEKVSTEDEGDVITEDIFGIELNCQTAADVVRELTSSKDTCEIDPIQWHVDLHCSSEKKLKRVGLLYDEHRSNFHLSKPENESHPQTCPGGLLRVHDSDHYNLTVNFIPSHSGLFKQWLVFDFGDRPCLALKLSVNFGSQCEMKDFEFKEQTINTADLWNETNSKIIKCSQADEWTKRLEQQYPTPGLNRDPAMIGDVQSLSRSTYKQFMHGMLTEEERACMELVAKYRTVTKIKVSQQLQLEDSLISAPVGELFGTISLDKPLHDDSETSRLVHELVETVFIKFHEQSEDVYEASRVQFEEDVFVVSLGQACVKQLHLKADRDVPVTFQCCISRQRFLRMHHAVDRVTCMDTVLPQGQQPNRFPEVDEDEHHEGLNLRQEQVVRLIKSLGTVEKEVTSYSGPTMILGPFGTGKTHTLANAIQRTLTERKDAKFLICTHSNSAADLYIREYLHEFCEDRTDIWMVRIYTTMRKLNTISETVKKYMLINAEGPRLPTEEECKDWVSSKGPSIVVVTLSTAVCLTLTATLHGYFSHILIDEAGQALETEAIIPLALATQHTSVVLAGDPKQMSPKVYSPRTTDAKFNMSLLQRLFKYDKQNDCHASCNLIINYRSCQPILDFLKVHYGTAFMSKSTNKEHPNLFPLNFVDVRGEDRLVRTSYMNAEEAKIISEYVKSLMDHWPDEWGRCKQSDVVVLSPYRVQVVLIRQEMRKKGLHAVTVETVQNVQGKQYRAVFLSTVRTRSSLNIVDTTSLPRLGGRNVRNKIWYGFLSDKGLLNTAFTRAQSLITVMGDPVALCSAGECQKTWQRYIKTCEKNGGIHSLQDLTMASIQNEIASAKHLLNPAAKTFVPRASAPSGASQRISTVTGRSAVSRAIEVQSCFSRSTNQQREMLPSLVTSAAAVESDDEDDEEELLIDEWLQDLKMEVDEYKRSHTLTENQKEDALTQGSDDRDAAGDQGPTQPAIHDQELEAGVRLHTAEQEERPPSASRTALQNVEIPTREQLLQDLHRMEREDRDVFLEDELYDSDDDESNLAATGQARETNVDELLRKNVQSPDIYKICIFRQDINGHTYAVPLDRQSGDEITITSIKRRGHALNNDKVLVKVLENREEQEVETDGEGGSERKIYGKIEGIIEHKANLRFRKFVCYLDPYSNNMMVPLDRSSPKMLIQGRKRNSKNNNVAVVPLFEITRRSAQTRKPGSSRRDVEVKLSERRQKLFLVRYLEWAERDPYPLGVVVEELEPGDTQENGMNILRLMYGIKAKCKRAARDQMQQEFPEGWCLPEKALQKREDFRSTKVIFTIDPPGSTDLDDAISCTPLAGQRYEVGVHIADVSYFIQQDSPMDKDAYSRATSFYHPFQGDAYHMLPKAIVTRLLSLLPNQNRLALSVIFTLDQEGQIVAEPVFTRSVVRSCQKLTYEEADKLIDCSSDTQSNEYMAVADPVRILYALSRHRRMQRLGDGWIVYNADDDDGGALSHPLAHSLIEELMLMTNNAVAEHVLSSYPDCAPLRRQLSPSQDQVERWKENYEKTARNSIRLPELLNHNHNGVENEDQDTEDREDVVVAAEVFGMVKQLCESQMSKGHMESIANLIVQDENHPLHAVALSSCYEIMESAEYVDSTSQTKPEKRAHYSLQMRAYTHFTSPIRRFIDLVVHRLLVASMENRPCPYSPREMADITHHCNYQNAKSKRFDKSTQELKMALKLKEAPLQATAFVEGISESSMKLLLPYRRYIQSRQRNIPFKLLKPSEKPAVESTNLQMAWKCRMYDYSTKCQAESPVSTRVPYLDLSYTIPEDKWQQILHSIKSMYIDGNIEGVKTAIEAGVIHAQGSGNPFSKRRINQENGPEKKEMGIMSFQRNYQLGEPCKVQMHAHMMKGMLRPKIQLFNMTSQLDVCAEHRAQPIECFSKIATEIPGREKNVKTYKSKWLSILSMTSCYSAVSNDDTVVLQNVPVTWHRASNEVTGHIELDREFLEVNHIPIWETNDGITINNYDYLCLHLTNLEVETKPRLKMMGYDRERQECRGPFNASDWKKQTCVVHSQIVKGKESQDCRTCQRLSSEKSIVVHFVVHQLSVPLPQRINGRHVASTVEFISKPEPNRREETAIDGLDSGSLPVLIKDIALQRPNRPDWHSDETLRILKREAEALTDLNVPECTLPALNSSQGAAVKNALQHTFSLIQGPPGTGKTVTGAYLAYFFTRLNQQLRAGKMRPQVLYCGPSNKSVDVVAAYLKKFPNISVVRVYSEQIERKDFPIPGVPGLVSKWSRKESSMPVEMKDIALHHLIRMRGKPHAAELAGYERKFRTRPDRISPRSIKDYKSTIFEATKEELQNHHIVLSTCNAAGARRISRLTRVIQVIVDEAGMCSEPETMIPLVSVKPNQVVLVGDHQQLRSIITEPNAKQLGMDISLLEKYKDKAKMLTIQYRMHERICEFPSSAFYDNRLETAESVRRRSLDPIWRIWPNNGNTPQVFCHVNGQEETLSVKTEEGNEQSKSNGAEIKHVMRIVQALISRKVSPAKIIILSQYRLQCAQIEERLRDDRDRRLQQVKVSTVVKSQGAVRLHTVFV